MSLETPHVNQALQRKLCLKAKHVDERRRDAWRAPILRSCSYEAMGLVKSLCASESVQALRTNLVREPDAGNPHVRFDEREVETEQGKARAFSLFV